MCFAVRVVHAVLPLGPVTEAGDILQKEAVENQPANPGMGLPTAVAEMLRCRDPLSTHPTNPIHTIVTPREPIARGRTDLE
jgi:hypothetical protein